MAGRIPPDFIDQVLARVDIVDVIDRRVPLRRKGKEYQACCPFHEEKTPSFTVSPSKQFYHCFGCGEHGTAIGFLMKHAHLGFVEAVEELAESAGLQLPATSAARADVPPEAQPAPLLDIVAEANRWFQRQLRQPHAKHAIAYLKGRGLDGRTSADFGIGYAPDGWDGLASALGDSDLRRRRLIKAGLLAQRDQPGGAGKAGKVYDRFRNRVIFPIEDHRGRVVAFGGRILGEGEPKYLNSPETPLFHKGAELYALHRARADIGRSGRSIVVEGYMDVVGLAQFGVGNAVATLGTATTRTHLQRLFRLAPEIVFCFDGDRAGRAAAWKAMQTALPEMHDGRRAAFLFLPEGEDPDSVVRAEGGEGFAARVERAAPLDEFLFTTLLEQVDLATTAGKAGLVALAKPLLAQLPGGAWREMLSARLSTETGLSAHQIDTQRASQPGRGRAAGRHSQPGQPGQPKQPGQLSPLALAISLLLQNPQLAASITDARALRQLNERGADILLSLLDHIARDPATTTARLLESFRAQPAHPHLEKLATRPNLIDPEALVSQFNDTLARLLEQHSERRRLWLIEELRRGRSAGSEKRALERELKQLLDARAAPGEAGGGK